ncbi:MAG: NADH-quinone oxidoreductase subunit K [Endomicrobiales bacterium]|nr:NADH-quinone oxidoreductase subunit K [Endomicrobiales bacterium]
MTQETAQLLRLYIVFLPLIFVAGFYCVITTRNLIRTLLGLEILTKAVTLMLALAGYLTGRTAMSQALIITLIVIEVVVIAVAAGVVLNIFRHNNSLDARNIRSLKG